jgi:ferredoxin
MGVLIWLHVSRVARPTMLPPRLLGIAIVAGLAVVAMLFPLGFGPAADPWQLPTSTSINLPSAWWLPITEQLPPVAAWMAPVVLVGLMLLVPALSRRPRVGRFAPSVVDPRLCTGCNQCPQDCPWDAITMVARDDDRPTLVALVDPTRCVSCGVCAGSCAPMGVGPPDRTGRAQLARVRELDQHTIAGIVVICCGETPVAQREALVARGAVLHPVSCVGNLHSSVVEMLLRAGADGVLVAGCAPRDCVGREGPKWMEQRLYHDREAELQVRVDRRRVGTATLTPGGLPEALATFDALAKTVAALRREQEAAELELEGIECVPVPLEVSE